MYLKLFEYLIHSMLMLINLYQFNKKTTKQRLNTIYIEVVGVVVDPGSGGGGGSRVVIGGGHVTVNAGGGDRVAIDVGRRRRRVNSDGRRRRHRW